MCPRVTKRTDDKHRTAGEGQALLVLDVGVKHAVLDADLAGGVSNDGELDGDLGEYPRTRSAPHSEVINTLCYKPRYSMVVHNS